VEFLLLFGGGPLLILALRSPGFLFLALWVGGVVTYHLSRPAVPPPPPDLRRIMHRVAMFTPFLVGILLMVFAPKPGDAERARGRALRQIFLRFAVLGAAVALATRYAMPAQFLDLPRQHPVLWLAIMILYPLLSVWPQEVIYRRFLFHRYAAIFPRQAGMVAASALAFGFAHVIFLNWIAIAMTTAGGAIFASDYGVHRSLRLACLEHSLYGCLVFTVGLGRFFYTGAAWHH
jgi:hypothetical protein